jgi:hypothetical protein
MISSTIFMPSTVTVPPTESGSRGRGQVAASCEHRRITGVPVQPESRSP